MSQRTVIIGGGIIGLSIAYELSSRGQQVTVADTGPLASQASWAGAGMLPPANRATAVHPYEHLEAISNQLHRQWAQQLTELTRIDTGYRQCGHLFVARTNGELAALSGGLLEWQEREIPFQRLTASDLTRRFNMPFRLPTVNLQLAIWVPQAALFNNPDHNRALIAACQSQEVELLEHVEHLSIDVHGHQIKSVQTSAGELLGDQFVFAAGPWTEQLLERFGVTLPMQPVRGQLALYRLPSDRLTDLEDVPVVIEGSRYLVPRKDGYVLAGATIEEAGFDCQVTPGEMADLRTWAQGLSEDLNENTFVKSWAGLRPGTYDGFPYLGQLAEFDNGLVATGHFKAGLQLSTGTATVIADLVVGQKPAIDLTPFSPARVGGR